MLQLRDQLQTVASFALDGLVSTMPVFLRGSLYVATSRGQLHIIRHFPDDSRRPFQMSGSVSIGDDGAELQGATFLAVNAGRIWAGGDGLTVFEPTSNESAPLRRTRLDSTLLITQPLQVFSAPDAVVCSGTLRALGSKCVAGMREQTVGATANLAVPAAARPLVSSDHQQLWNLTADGNLYGVSWQSLTDGKTTVSPVEKTTQLADGDEAVEFFGLSTVGSDYGAFTTNSDRGQLLLVPLADGNTVRRIDVARPLAAPAVPMGRYWMVAFRQGAIALLNVDEGELLPELFLPAAQPSEPPNWLLPIVTQNQRAVVYDGHHRLFAVRHASGLEKLELEVETTVESPLRVHPVHVASRIWGVNLLGQLVAFNSSSLQLEAAMALDADVDWGPEAVEGRALMTTADGMLICIGDAAQPLWQVQCQYGPIVGCCARTAGEFTVASQSGFVWRLRADSGEPVGQVTELKQSLAFGPLMFGDRLAVVSRDGTLLVLRNAAGADSQ